MGLKIKVEGIIELSDSWDFTDKDEIDWFNSILNDRDNTVLMLWSNEVGDEIGSTNKIKTQKLQPLSYAKHKRINKEDFIKVIKNCNSIKETLKAEELFFDQMKDFNMYERMIIQIYFAKRKDELVNIP